MKERKVDEKRDRSRGRRRARLTRSRKAQREENKATELTKI